MKTIKFAALLLTILPLSLQAEAAESNKKNLQNPLEINLDRENISGVFLAEGEPASLNKALAVQGEKQTLIRFSSIEKAPGQFELELVVHGKTLTASVDKDNKSAKLSALDARGQAIFLNEKDRLQLSALLKTYELQGYGKQNDAANMLKRLLSLWAQTPDMVSLQRTIDGVSTSAYQSLCSYNGLELAASHDGNQCGYDDPECTSLALVGSRGSNTESFINGQWTTAVPDHIPNVRQRGECYGNCGGGCPSGNQILTRDCLNHDQCVRNGHSLISGWCNDDFTYTFDDAMFAPECPGTD
ncbi:hypothetical protein [Thalassomonas actiniarum]|uniref:Uncharacterized protein n=1 Tax=Thalassomonas actiniarum TaxID=485447 RepID=A0AAE9YUS6_9GAMM|nr:hypothetical protein [Thalassomonas actiniarum]WDE01506.1 hypothetical protein SG35_013335 [Thalassomonas actiniarum]